MFFAFINWPVGPLKPLHVSRLTTLAGLCSVCGPVASMESSHTPDAPPTLMRKRVARACENCRGMKSKVRFGLGRLDVPSDKH